MRASWPMPMHLHIYKAKPINWGGGQDLQKLNDRRIAYIAALKSADAGDFLPLMIFISIREDAT